MDWIVTIGPAKPGDTARIEAFLVAQGLPAGDVADHLADFILARDDGALVGTIGFERHGDTAFLRSLAVAPSHRGRGLGRRLTREALERATRGGLIRAFLLAQASPAYFRSQGFETVDDGDFPPGFPAQEELHRGLCADVVLMSRELP